MVDRATWLSSSAWNTSSVPLRHKGYKSFSTPICQYLSLTLQLRPHEPTSSGAPLPEPVMTLVLVGHYVELNHVPGFGNVL